MNRYRANLSPCRIPATISKRSVSPSGEWTLQIRVSPRVFLFFFLFLFYLYELLRFDRLLESVMLLIGFSENHFDSSKNILDFWFDAVESQGIINLNHYESKAYTPVILDNSEVNLRRERKDTSICSSLYRVLVIYGIAVSELQVVEFPCLTYFCWYYIKSGSFRVYNFSLNYVEFSLSKVS